MDSSSSALMVTISGIRGIVGESFTPPVVLNYVSEFGMIQERKSNQIIVGRDSRVSGSWVFQIVQGVLLALGFEVIDIGIVPTPTVQFMVKKHRTDGGVVITSSHNDVMWNGLKFVEAGDGLFLSPKKCEKLFAIAESKQFTFPSFEQCNGKVVQRTSAIEEHVDAVLALPFINREKICTRCFRVCLDTVNGAGGPIMLELLRRIGCEVIGINLDPSGIFAHKPEPIPEHLGSLCEIVRRNHAHLGIAVDPDVDRCVLIDENGEALGEEYTLALAVKFYLEQVQKTPVCKNLSTTRAIDDICKKYGCPLYATAVGEINVADKMKEVNSLIGGEGNGGVMLSKLHIGRDAIVATILTLQHLSTFDGTISKLKSTLPQYEIVKLKAPIAGIDPDAVFAHLLSQWKDQDGITVNTIDGLYISADEWWVHLRRSNTEPIVRVIGEASGGRAQSEKICKRFLQDILDFSKHV